MWSERLPIFGRGVWYDTFVGPPASGVLSIASDILLPANHQFRVQYQAGLDTYGFSSSLATADGHVNFTISPEPATLALLAPCSPWRGVSGAKHRASNNHIANS